MKFKFFSSNTESTDSTSSEPKERISNLIEENPVLLFMKGTPEAPQCGFSNRVIQVLNSWDVPFESINVLSDENIRQEIKDFSNWPTIPLRHRRRTFNKWRACRCSQASIPGPRIHATSTTSRSPGIKLHGSFRNAEAKSRDPPAGCAE